MSSVYSSQKAFVGSIFLTNKFQIPTYLTYVGNKHLQKLKHVTLFQVCSIQSKFETNLYEKLRHT